MEYAPTSATSLTSKKIPLRGKIINIPNHISMNKVKIPMQSAQHNLYHNRIKILQCSILTILTIASCTTQPQAANTKALASQPIADYKRDIFENSTTHWEPCLAISNHCSTQQIKHKNTEHVYTVHSAFIHALEPHDNTTETLQSYPNMSLYLKQLKLSHLN